MTREEILKRMDHCLKNGHRTCTACELGDSGTPILSCRELIRDAYLELSKCYIFKACDDGYVLTDVRSTELS